MGSGFYRSAKVADAGSGFAHQSKRSLTRSVALSASGTDQYRISVGAASWTILRTREDVRRLCALLGTAHAIARGAPASSPLRVLRAIILDEAAWATGLVREFFEVGALSLRGEYGTKHLEAWVRARGRGTDAGAWAWRWIAVRDAFVALFEGPDAAEPSAVVTLDVHVAVTCVGECELAIGHPLDGGRAAIELLFATAAGRGRVHDAVQLAAAAAASPGRHPHGASSMASPARASSFAPPRGACVRTTFFVDGRGYFAAVARALACASEEVFVAGWWLDHFVELVRGPLPGVDDDAGGSASSTDVGSYTIRLLDMLADRVAAGVRVYVLPYRNISQARARGRAQRAALHESSVCVSAEGFSCYGGGFEEPRADRVCHAAPGARFRRCTRLRARGCIVQQTGGRHRA